MIAFDSDRSFRRDLSPAYKANRRNKSDDYYDVLGRLRSRLEADAGRIVNHEYEVLERARFEADDVIAALVWQAHQEGQRSVICSSDKDLHALLAEGEVLQATKIERTGQRSVRANWMTAVTLKVKYGVTPHQWIDYRCMVGDSSDGLAGCVGIGASVAAEVLQACGSLDAFWGNPFKPRISAGARTKLVQFRAEYLSVRQLIELRNDCLEGVPA